MCPQVECLNPSEKVIIFMCFPPKDERQENAPHLTLNK